MPFHLQPFADVGLDAALLEHLIARHESGAARLRRLWEYYRNPEVGGAAKLHGAANGAMPRVRLAQESGLPPRITGIRDIAQDDRSRTRREVVIENDIGWRIQAMVDFMFGKPVLITSTARDEGTRKTIERVLDSVWETSGGIALLQDMSLLGHVYGHVDLMLREVDTLPDSSDPAVAGSEAVRIEVVEPTRGIPVQNPDDYRTLDAYVIHSEREINAVEAGPSAGGRWSAFWRAASGDSIDLSRRKRSTYTEVISAAHRQVYRDGKVIESREWRLTRDIPVVHIQNISQPFRFAGMFDVEPLIPLQNELNTRLSDRACRVTMQSFKMYLAKGIEGFDKVPVGPGQLWSTDTPDPSSATALTVTNGTRFKVGDQVRPGTSNEVMFVNTVSGNNLTVTRGYGGTTATALANGMALTILGNAALEGDDAAAAKQTNRVRKQNWTQIFSATVNVSGSMQAAKAYGIADELDYQKQERTRELLRDLENCVINGVAPAANQQGSSTVRRTMNGILKLISTNVFAPDTGAIPPGGGAGSDELNEAVLNAAIRSIWEQSSGKVDTIVVNGVQKRRINSFISQSQAYQPEDSAFRNLVSVYESDFGVCRVIMSRWVPPSKVLLLDSSRIEVMPLRGRSFGFKPLAATGDAHAGQVLGEYTTEFRNENAHGVINDLAVSAA